MGFVWKQFIEQLLASIATFLQLLEKKMDSVIFFSAKTKENLWVVMQNMTESTMKNSGNYVKAQ